MRSTKQRLGLVAVLGVLLVTSACRVNQNNLWAADKLNPAYQNPAPTIRDVAYGPDAAHRLDVYRHSAGDPAGTLIYIHGGGWTANDKANATSTFITSQTERGWDVVSINYRLAGYGPHAPHAPQLMADVDRAIRYTKAHARELGISTNKVIISGGSAGATMAYLAALVPGQSVDPKLPADLAAVSPKVDAVVSMVGPSDMNTLWKAGYIAPGSEQAFLGCVPPGMTSVHPGDGPCSDDTMQRYSPLFWTGVAKYFGIQLVPAYIAVGGADQLVTVATQGDPIHAAWAASAGETRTWYDVPPQGGHNIDYDLNRTAFGLWLNMVLTDGWL